MLILDARTDFPGSQLECLTVLVDRIPAPYELDYYAYPITERQSTLYVATTADGYINYLVESPDASGSYGRPSPLRLIGGTYHVVHGPWSGNPGTVREHAPNVDLYAGDVRLHTDPDSFYQGAGNGYSGNLTWAAARRAQAIADQHPARDSIPNGDNTLRDLLTAPQAAAPHDLDARTTAVHTLGPDVAAHITWENAPRDGRLYGHLRNGLAHVTIWHEPGTPALFTRADCPATDWQCRSAYAVITGRATLLQKVDYQPIPEAICPEHQHVPLSA